MTTITAGGQRFDMGRVIKMTFGAIGRNWRTFGLLALLLVGMPYAIQLWLQGQVAEFGQAVSGAGQSAAAASVGTMIAELVVFLAMLILYFAGMLILQAALVHGVVSDLNGRKASVGECFRTGARFALPLLAIGFLMGIALFFGFLLLIVPGVLMALAWSAAVPAEVIERTGVFGAFSRSAELTRNHRGALFGLFVLYAVASWILLGFVLATSGGFTGLAQASLRANPVSILLSTILQLFQSVIGSAGIAAIYYELRSIKEGIGPEALASVFD